MSCTFSLWMWARTKSSAAKVSQLADMHERPAKKNLQTLLKTSGEMVFCHKKCSDPLWEKNCSRDGEL